MKLNMYGLLHLNQGEKSAMNVFVKDFEHQTEIYIKNAITLSRSLGKKGICFTLLTNEKEFIWTILRKLKHGNSLTYFPHISFGFQSYLFLLTSNQEYSV